MKWFRPRVPQPIQQPPPDGRLAVTVPLPRRTAVIAGAAGVRYLVTTCGGYAGTDDDLKVKLADIRAGIINGMAVLPAGWTISPLEKYHGG